MFHLAQINIATFRRLIADPVNADFVANLDLVNARAESQPGFVWRLTGNGGDATDIRAYDDPNILVNISLWADLETLAAFVYREPAHRDIMRRRREWFDRMDIFLALWWVPQGHLPTVEEGKAKLDLLQKIGPSEQAFLFSRPFGPPGTANPAPVLDRCA